MLTNKMLGNVQTFANTGSGAHKRVNQIDASV